MDAQPAESFDAPTDEAIDETVDETTDEPRLDKTFFEVVPLNAPDDALAYWLSRPVVERLQALERLRRIFYGPDYAREGLQRVLEVVQFERR
jgi:hypothetical protein